jgi:hypothetical protein
VVGEAMALQLMQAEVGVVRHVVSEVFTMPNGDAKWPIERLLLAIVFAVCVVDMEV